MATVLTPFADTLREAGGAGAPPSTTAGLRHVLRATLQHGLEELALAKSGYAHPVTVAFASGGGHLLAVLPLPAAFAADPAGSPVRAVILAAGIVAALRDLAGTASEALAIRVGDHDGHLLLAHPAPDVAPGDLDELAPLAFEERLHGVDRLRGQGVAVPFALLEEAAGHLRKPIGAGHPLRVAEAVVLLRGDPTQPSSLEAREEAVLAIVGSEPAAIRPHDDPDLARRIARRMLQRLDGFGKWGGYHTDFAHLTRGFAGNEKALATQVAEALLSEGLLQEKPSVGQRHVFLNPRRVADIRALIDTGATPPGLGLPQSRAVT